MAQAVRRTMAFLLNDDVVRCGSVPTDRTLLDFLRLERRLTGTKEGCAEGDCGACSVLIGRLRDGRVEYAPANACIRLLASLDGCHVVTIEHLSRAGLHPVQAAMVDCHGSQCGFCTPGIVVALAAHRLAGGGDVAAALQGNLCRCTGYGPILEAAASAARASIADDPLVRDAPEVAARLAALEDAADIELAGPEGVSYLPASAASFAAAVAARPEAEIVAGATDLALGITKRLQVPAGLIFTQRVAAFERIEVEGGRLRIGPSVTFAAAMPVLGRDLPELADLWPRIGGPQVRHAGTVLGNIANGSPIGDGPPVWIALGAELVLRQGEERRRVPVEDYFLGYRRQDLRPGEFIEALEVPLPRAGTILAAHKVSKRFDEDISSVMGAFCLEVREGTVAAARIAFGGMAGVPKRARAVEAALLGRVWSEAAVVAAAARLAEDFQPLGDMRASAGYRLAVAAGLLRRVWLGSAGAATDVRRMAHV